MYPDPDRDFGVMTVRAPVNSSSTFVVFRRRFLVFLCGVLKGGVEGDAESPMFISENMEYRTICNMSYIFRKTYIYIYVNNKYCFWYWCIGVSHQ